MSKKHQLFEKWRTPYSKVTLQKETPGNRLIHSRLKKTLSATPRATHCTDRARTPTTAVSCVGTAFLC